MVVNEPVYIIGIDLGTTNSALSFVDLSSGTGKDKGITLFEIPQLTGAGEVGQMSVLPSFCYLPGKYDVDPEALGLPWDNKDPPFRVVGTFARDHGSKVPARLVSSAKSWLCHSRADRRARILPWGAGDKVPGVSPVEATASYLSHIRNAWNHAQSDEDLYMENQYLIITVPASFDEVARDLTLEAAKKAGLQEVMLLEEPLAAFYSWLIRHENDWKEHIFPGDLVLVCDVGGGTTDFTLITLRETEGSPRFERIAVGDHLILGGDNIDQAIARHVEKQLGPSANLTADRWKTLCHLCRQAKENILNQGKERETITMMGEGSRLIGGTLTAEIERATLEQIVLEEFFPLVDRQKENRVQPPAGGVTESGLPYEPDTAITRHIGKFLERHAMETENYLGSRTPFPDLILFNGGSLKARVVQERVRKAIRQWFGQTGENRPRVLENRNLDIAVAMGASYYGLVKLGRGVGVGSGSPRAYYLGIESPDPQENAQQAVCVVERGMDEGTRIALAERKFEVIANRPVSFDLFSSSYRSGDRTGDMVTVDKSMTRMPPLQTVIQFGRKGAQAAIPIRVEAEYTETGVLALWCRSLSTDHRWQLRFQLRQMQHQAGISEKEVFDSGVVNEVVVAVSRAFSNNSAKETLAGLVRTVSDIVGRSRDDWPLSVLRSIADALLEGMENRKHTPQHEIRWLNLTGFCLRPGFGDGFDNQRIKTLWKIYKTGVIFRKDQQAVNEWWILWRRVAGGLTAGQQRQFAQDIRSLLMPKKGTKIKIPPQQRLEMWMAVANMERLAANEKAVWGDALISEITPKKSKPQQFWALSRIGAREPLYGPVDRVVSADKTAQWAEFLMEPDWKNPGAVAAALARMCRKTGDRARDLDENLVGKIIEWMESRGMEKETRVLNTVVPVEREEESAMFGESLPAGLIMHE
ncbi:MAG: hsp70 family protein [Desulfobacteraceae bacterium]|nr:hsp70 family protein [Desulfobacteraceae bacterium]